MPANFKAWEVRRYGGPDQLRPTVRPRSKPKSGQILIEIRASAVTRADTMMRAGVPKFARAFLGLRRPRNNLAGTGFSGVVVETGPDVARFRVGDAVFGEAGMAFGANAEVICLDENGTLMKKPEGIRHEDAAVLCDGALTSLHFLRNVAEVKSGQKVLVLGGSGSLGSAAVQLARHFGAHVTATTSERNADLVASLGAQRVIDYQSRDVTALAERYDIIFDTLGVQSFDKVKHLLTPTGRYICPVLNLSLLWSMFRSRRNTGPKALFSAAGMQSPQKLRPLLSDLLNMMRDGTFAPVMDRSYPLNCLPEAHAYLETGHKTGNVVIA